MFGTEEIFWHQWSQKLVWCRSRPQTTGLGGTPPDNPGGDVKKSLLGASAAVVSPKGQLGGTNGGAFRRGGGGPTPLLTPVFLIWRFECLPGPPSAGAGVRTPLGGGGVITAVPPRLGWRSRERYEGTPSDGRRRDTSFAQWAGLSS
jgi:hypothetical protein